jgi:pSer/pThr/pTyr-binding forkhead associated (FHA) protein
MESPTIAPAGEPGPPATAPDPEWEQATMAPADADLDTTMANPPRFAPAPPPAPPPPNFLAEPDPDPDPVNDDLDGEGCDSGPTLLQPLPPLAVPGAPTRPPHRPSPRPAAAAAPAAGTVRLEHWSPKVKTAVVVLSKAETCVGRDRGDIQYPEDSHLSKKHARFLRDARGGLCVEDLGSLNGTYLRLRAPVKLEHRDVLFLGRHAFRFELLQYDDKDDRTIEGDPLTRVQGVQGKAPRARLVKRQAEGFRGLPFFFGTQRYVLGRTDGTHNFQKDDLMSRRHAALEFREGDYWLEDLGSQNGTYLRLRGPRPLESGDVVMMGDQYFKVP